MTIENTIDAFVDGAIVDTTALDAALASSDGRAYLFDVLALRQTMQTSMPAAAVRVTRIRRPFLRYASAAVVALALVGAGYAAGLRQAPAAEVTAANTSDGARPPEPTRVIELTPGVNWHESRGGD
ncbi:MAG: hypothetical protein WD690_19170 [Vicinamibacterales bacterium]